MADDTLESLRAQRDGYLDALETVQRQATESGLASERHRLRALDAEVAQLRVALEEAHRCIETAPLNDVAAAKLAEANEQIARLKEQSAKDAQHIAELRKKNQQVGWLNVCCVSLVVMR